MWANIANFVSKNWIDILLVIVGASAFIIYWVQERRKISEAASLIVLQVEELQTSIAEVGSYISEGKLNDGAFYESQMLFKRLLGQAQALLRKKNGFIQLQNV